MKNVKETVIEMVAEQLGVSSSSVKITDVLREDLQFDDLHLIELTMGLEEEFEIEIDDEKFESVVTVQDVVDYILDN